LDLLQLHINVNRKEGLFQCTIVYFPGTLVEKYKIIYSRKLDLKTLRDELMNEHVKAGVVRQFANEDNDNLSEEEIQDRYVKKHTIKYIPNAPREWSTG
jgi:hypothetical protein